MDMTNNLHGTVFAQEQRTVLEGMHRLMLEALRHREQEIFQYLVILGPALGSFIWLYLKNVNAAAFIAGTIGVLLLLLLGTFYSLTLGYNFRYIILELAKLETILGVRDAMLNDWPRTPEDFLQRYKWGRIPWCTPPEMIKVFFWAFIGGIIGVLIMVWQFKPTIIEIKQQCLIIVIGGICLVLGLLAPIWFGWKFRKQVRKEPETWETTLEKK